MGQTLEDISKETRHGLGKIPRRDIDFAILRIRCVESSRGPSHIGQIDHGSIQHVETTRHKN